MANNVLDGISNYSGYTMAELQAEKHDLTYSDFTLEDLKGNGVLSFGNWLLEQCLKELGCSIKKDMSRNVKYIVFDAPYICPISRKNITIIDAIRNKKSADDFPKIIDQKKLSALTEPIQRELQRRESERLAKEVAEWRKRSFVAEIVDIQPEDLNGKNVCIVRENSYYRKVYERMARFCGATVSQRPSRKTDYILISTHGSEVLFDPEEESDRALYNYMTDAANKNSLPRVVSLDALHEKCRTTLRDQCEAETREEKVARAKRIFNNLIPRLEKEVWNYPCPMSGNCGYDTRLVRNENIDKQAVREFFTFVEEYKKSSAKIEDNFYDPLCERLEHSFYEMPTDFNRYLGLYFPVALAIALFVFVDPTWIKEVHFYNGKHDENCEKRAGFRLSYAEEYGTVIEDRHF